MSQVLYGNIVRDDLPDIWLFIAQDNVAAAKFCQTHKHLSQNINSNYPNKAEWLPIHYCPVVAEMVSHNALYNN